MSTKPNRMGTQEILHRTHNHSSLGGVIDHVDGNFPILHEPATAQERPTPMYLCQEPSNPTAILSSEEFPRSYTLCISQNPCVGITTSIPAENTISNYANYGVICEQISDPKVCISQDACTWDNDECRNKFPRPIQVPVCFGSERQIRGINETPVINSPGNHGRVYPDPRYIPAQHLPVYVPGRIHMEPPEPEHLPPGVRKTW